MDSKSPDAFRTISEVAEWLDVPTHVLRFWESRFTQVKPVKRAGGRRYYRPADMELLGGIKRLLHDDGLTIRGVQKLLREEGVRHVAALSPGADSPEGPRGASPTAPVETPMAIDVPVQPPRGEVVNFIPDTEAAPGLDTGKPADPDESLRRWPFVDDPAEETVTPPPLAEPPLVPSDTTRPVAAADGPTSLLETLRATPSAQLAAQAPTLRPLVARLAALHARMAAAG